MFNLSNKITNTLFTLSILLILLVGCQADKIENSGGSGGSIYKENITVYAERTIAINITAPFEINWSYTSPEISPKHGSITSIDRNKGVIKYQGKDGYIGKDEFTFHISNKNNGNEFILKKYIVDVKKIPFEDNKDYSISFLCETESRHHGSQAISTDINIVSDDLHLIEKVHDDIDSFGTNIPYYTRIETESFSQEVREQLKKYPNMKFADEHHRVFKRHMQDNLSITCNYAKGFVEIFLPIKNRREWEATRTSTKSSRTFNRNDMFFYISSLSDLHSKIYLKEFLYSNNQTVSFNKANDFMNKTFPKSHYTVELTSNYRDGHPIFGLRNYISTFFEDNKIHYVTLTKLSNSVTSGNVSKLLQKIADNYESYYLSGTQQCLSPDICATLFPEYGQSVTTNPSFKNNLSGWNQDLDVIEPSLGRIEYLPTKNVASLELASSIPSNSNIPISTISLSQTLKLGNNDIDNYFLHFDLQSAIGSSEGGGLFSCVSSSGLAGAYVCYNDISNTPLACLTWSDHCNNFDWAWGPASHTLESSNTFFNTRMTEVVRRVTPSEEQFIYTIDLGGFTKNNLPKVYEQKNKINTIEYGIFTSEFRATDGRCYFCRAWIKANEINLYKKLNSI